MSGPPARDDSLDDITVTLAVPEKAAAPEPDRSGFQAGEAVQMAAYSAIGTRKSQQDAVRFAVGERRSVAVLCDGMGGPGGGRLASTLAVETFLDACQGNLRRGMDAGEAFKKFTSTKGRFEDAVKVIDPRKK